MSGDDNPLLPAEGGTADDCVTVTVTDQVRKLTNPRKNSVRERGLVTRNRLKIAELLCQINRITQV